MTDNNDSPNASKSTTVITDILLVIVALACLPVSFSILAVLQIRKLFRKRRSNPDWEQPEGLTNPSVSVIIPTWNGKAHLEELLPALEAALAAAPEIDSEVIVADNGSADGTAEFLEVRHKRNPRIKTVRLEENLGFRGGCHAGVQAAKGEIILMLNNDMVPEPDFLEPLIKPFSDPDVFAVTAQIFFPESRARREETGLTRAGAESGMISLRHEIPSGTEPVPAFYAGGGSSAYRKDRFLELGGFSPLYEPFYWEDVDLSFRAWKRGWRILLAPSSRVLHKHRGTIGRFPASQVQEIFRKNMLLFQWANFSDGDMFLNHWASLAFRLIRWPFRDQAGQFQPSPLSAITATGSIFHVARQILDDLNAPIRLRDRTVFQISEHAFLTDAQNRTNELQTNGTPKRIQTLFLFPYSLYPTSHGGAMRMFNIIRALSKHIDIYLICFIDSEEERETNQILKRFCREVVLILRRPELHTRRLLKPEPLSIAEFESAQMWKEMIELLERVEIDIIQLEYSQMAQYLLEPLADRTIITAYDLNFETCYRKFRMLPISLEKFNNLLNWMKFVRYEIINFRKMRQVHVMSEREKKKLTAYMGNSRNIIAIPNGVDTKFFAPPGTPRESNSILFVGNFRHTPNLDAILFFYRETLPHIRRNKSDFHLYIVGTAPPPEVVELGRDPDVTITGFVEDIREYYWKCAVFVAPIRYGSGTRLKILEAFAAGIPVVSTSLACEGIIDNPDQDIIIADDPPSFAEATVRLLTERDEARRIAQNARALVVNHFDWDSIATNLIRRYEDILCRSVH